MDFAKAQFHDSTKAPCAVMRSAAEDSVDKMDDVDEGDAHDIMNDVTWQMMKLGKEGHRGYWTMSEWLEEEFIRSVYTDRLSGAQTPRISEAEAREEFLRDRDGALRVAKYDAEVGNWFAPACPCVRSKNDSVTEEHQFGFHSIEKDPLSYDSTELGLAKMLADLYYGDYLYMMDSAVSVWWDEKQWRRDHSGLLTRKRSELIVERTREASINIAQLVEELEERDMLGDAERKKYERQLKALAASKERASTLSGLRHIIEMVAHQDGVAQSDSDFDSNKMLLGTPNGVLELSTSGDLKVRQASRFDRVTMSTAVPYEEGLKSDRLDKYFEMCIPDPELLEFLQKVCGATLQGGNPDRVLPILHGTGGTGKSTFMGLFEAVLGDYGGPLSPSIFRSSDSDEPRPDLIAAMRKRGLFLSELRQNIEAHLDQIKRLTGGDDKVTARAMRSDKMLFLEPQFIPFIATNVIPTLIGADKAFADRAVVFSFNSVIRNPSIGAGTALREDEEAQAAFLSWVGEGWGKYCEDGLRKRPKSVRAASREFMAKTSNFNAFIDECFVMDSEARAIPISTINEAYTAWCNSHSIPEFKRDSMTQSLPQKLQDIGFRRMAKKEHQVDPKTGERTYAVAVRKGFRFKRGYDPRGGEGPYQVKQA